MPSSSSSPSSHPDSVADDTSRDDAASRLVVDGCTHEGNQDWTAAVAAYQGAVDLQPQHSEVCYFAHNNLGYSLLQLGRFDEAATHCEAAIFVNPDRHNAHKNLGLARQGQGRWLEAAQSLIEAARRCPQDRRAWLHLQKLLENHPDLPNQSESLAAAITDVQGHYAAYGSPPRLN